MCCIRKRHYELRSTFPTKPVETCKGVIKYDNFAADIGILLQRGKKKC